MISWGPKSQKQNLKRFWNWWPWPSENYFYMIPWRASFPPKQKQKREKLLRCLTLTIGKSFLNDSKRAQISKKKLEKLLKLMTLTIGKWFLDDFKRAQCSPKKTWETSQIFFRIFGPEIIDFWSPRGSRTPGPSRNFIYFLCCGPWILTSLLIVSGKRTKGPPPYVFSKYVTAGADFPVWFSCSVMV